MMLNILQWTGQPHNKDLSSPNVNSAQGNIINIKKKKKKKKNRIEVVVQGMCVFNLLKARS